MAYDEPTMKEATRELTLEERVQKLEGICNEQEHHLDGLRRAMRRVLGSYEDTMVQPNFSRS